MSIVMSRINGNRGQAANIEFLQVPHTLQAKLTSICWQAHMLFVVSMTGICALPLLWWSLIEPRCWPEGQPLQNFHSLGVFVLPT